MSTNKVVKVFDPYLNIGKYGKDINTGFTVLVLGISKDVIMYKRFYELEVITPISPTDHRIIMQTKPITFCTFDSFVPFTNQKVYKLLYV